MSRAVVDSRTLTARDRVLSTRGGWDARLRDVTADNGDALRQREEWERRRRRYQRLQDLGLMSLGLGVLVLVFIALTYRTG